MDISSELKNKGWHLSKEGLEMCQEGLDRVTASAVIQKALNMDLRDIGGNFFPEDMKAAKLESISGPGVVQIQKIKNASAPKYEYGSGAPPILRLLLTDGNTFVNCLQWGAWKSVSMDTPPGTKIYLKPGKIMMQNSFMLLSETQFTFLGGCVAPMVEKWELCKRLASHVRTKENLDGTGPPPWIPFGKPINTTKTKTSNFRALEQDGKEAKENASFKQQRLANIAEVSRVKEGKPKVFGGGKDVKPMNAKSDSNLQSNNNPNESGYNRPPRNFSEFEDNQSSRNQDNRYDKNRSNQDFNKPQSHDGSSNYGQQFSRDKRNDQRNKSNTNGYFNDKNQRTYQQKTFSNSYRENADNANPSRRFQKSNYNESQTQRATANDRYHNNDRRSNNIEDITQKTSQIKLHGYDNQNSGQVFVASKPFLKPGVEVMAKYWEDNKFYRATVHAVGKEGTTCVVHFMEYGNYEEVLIDDVQPLQVHTGHSGWDVGPISFRPSHWENNRNQDFPPISEFHHNSNRSHSQQHGHQERQRTPRQDRPSAKLYQPPHQRQTS
ncbi:tudor domain-containing protein 3-like [Argiope bruennichi]|uniref:tudor domain-containing protein 3-like n=1 Tax=Argiope bruennichi TaxID=94029 RepID=UPI0024948A35|nr:tudor domain-containing protein 3-like [Argiope bruennichi]